MSRVTIYQLQTQLTAAQNSLKTVQAQLARVQTQLTQGQAELKRTQAALGQSQAALVQSQAALGQSQAAFGQSQAALGQSQDELRRTRDELEQTKAKLAALEKVQLVVPTQSETVAVELTPSRKPIQRAYLFGLNYPGTPNELRGCVPDVKLMASLLREKFSYSEEQIHVLTDPDLVGPKDVLDYLKEGLTGLQSGDLLFFHYSGHGTQVKDLDKDELDGFDEAIYTHRGVVTDDRIAEVLMTIPAGVNVVMIFDCCNSGTICDLPYRLISATYNLKESSKQFPANIITILGCRDNQTSADAYVVERQGNFGALTSSVAKLIETGKLTGLSWKELCLQLQTVLKTSGFTQVPQVSSNREALFNEPVKFSL